MAGRTSAAGSSGGLYIDYSAGVQPGTLLVALDRNMIQEEHCHAVEDFGFAVDLADSHQLSKMMIAAGHGVGELLEFEAKQTPVIYSAAKSTANPGFPDYLPVIARTADVDVTSAQAPDLVTAMRAEQATVIGVSSWAVTCAGSVVTFPNNASAIALCTQLQEDALVQRFLSSGQSATYAGSGGDYGNPRCINVSGTDYAITAVNVASRTVTVTGSPSNGTAIFYPHRIAGSSTSIRLFKLTGFVPVAQGDADGQYIAALRMMDRGQGHVHSPTGATNFVIANIGGANLISTVGGGPLSSVGQSNAVGVPVTDGINGTPRTGKTTDPRGHARYVYTWARRLIA